MSARNDADNGRVPYQREKIRLMLDEGYSHVKTLKQLATELGCKSHSNFNGKMSDALLEKLRGFYKIPDDSECWGEFMAGSLEDFREEFRKLGSLGEPPLTPNNKSGDPVDDTPQSGNDRLVTLEMSFFQETEDSAHVDLNLTCRVIPLGSEDGASRNLGIHRGILRLNCGNGQAYENPAERGAKKRASWLGYLEPYLLEGRNNTQVKITAQGTTKELIWEVEAQAKEYLYNVCPDDPYCQLVKLTKGDRLTVIFETFYKDVAFVLVDTETSENEELNRNQQAIIDQIEKMALSRNRQAGSDLFCSHTRVFTAGETE